jgi:hypothetical protein
MSENPYQPPTETGPAVGVLSGSREDLRKVATYQKGVLVCLLLQILMIIGQVLAPQGVATVVSIASLLTSLAGSVFVFLLAIRVYGTGMGILFGVLCLIPCIGLISLLIVNGKATSVLRQNGIKVGLMGANLADV